MKVTIIPHDKAKCHIDTKSKRVSEFSSYEHAMQFNVISMVCDQCCMSYDYDILN